MGWQGTLVLTLWLPKVFGLSPTKQCSFFFFFTFSFPPITDCWRVVIVHLCEFLSPFPWCKCRPCCKGVTSWSVRRPQWVGHLCSLLEITNQSYRATLPRRCPSHHPPPSPSRPLFLVHSAKIAELSFVLGQTDRQITLVCLIVLCLQAMTAHVRPSGWKVFLLTFPLSRSARHVEHTKHTNTPGRENRGVVLAWLLEIEHSPGML